MPPLAYFGYGSNMLRLRLLARNVVLLDQGQPAVAEGFKLVFNKASIDGSSKANLTPATGEKVWGVLFTVGSGSLNDLDKAEGAPDHYRREHGIRVQSSIGAAKAMTYLAQPDKILPASGQPYDWYLALVLAGAIGYPGIPRKWLPPLPQLAHPQTHLHTPTPNPTSSNRPAKLSPKLSPS